MTIEDFKKSLTDKSLPKGLGHALSAIWYDAQGDWDKAHELAQKDGDENGAWVHAYLHRKEGDLENAAYWYHQAKRPVCRRSLELEWEEIAKALL